MASATFPLSAAEYLDRERGSEVKHEYIDGELRAMAGASRLHNLIVLRLAAIFEALMAEKRVEAYVNDMRVRIPDGPYYYPDAVVAPSPPKMEDAAQDTLLDPLVVVEVLSPSTETIDRGEKLDNYRLIPSLTDYLLVFQDRMRIDHYSRVSANEWRLVTRHSAEETVALASIGAELKLSDIYARWMAEQSA